MVTEFHQPVLVDEVLEYLHLAPGQVVIDGTLGGAGHAEQILAHTAPDGILIGLDLDPQALERAAARLAADAARTRFAEASFRALDERASEMGFASVDGILLDLGVSSHQLDSAARGFRFGDGGAEEVPLDMRLGPSAGAPARALLARAKEPDLERIFREFGELPGSRRLARKIIEARKTKPLENAADLVAIVRDSGIGRGRRHNPATLVFQALRIAVNDELRALGEALDAAVRVLRPGGHLVVIAYHSLEDRIVKNHLRDGERGCTCPPRTPVCICGGVSTWRVLTRKPVRPSESEVGRNPRARSARLRAAQRTESRIEAAA